MNLESLNTIPCDKKAKINFSLSNWFQKSCQKEKKALKYLAQFFKKKSFSSQIGSIFLNSKNDTCFENEKKERSHLIRFSFFSSQWSTFFS